MLAFEGNCVKSNLKASVNDSSSHLEIQPSFINLFTFAFRKVNIPEIRWSEKFVAITNSPLEKR